jgi:hypothetical protein
MCVYNIDLVRSGRGNTGGITAKDRGKSLYKGPPKTRTRVIEIGVCGVTESRSQLRRVFFSCVM